MRALGFLTSSKLSCGCGFKSPTRGPHGQLMSGSQPGKARKSLKGNVAVFSKSMQKRYSIQAEAALKKQLGRDPSPQEIEAMIQEWLRRDEKLADKIKKKVDEIIYEKKV